MNAESAAAALLDDDLTPHLWDVGGMAGQHQRPLAVRPHLRPPLLPFLADHAVLFDSRGWTVDPDLPHIVTTLDLDDALAIGWRGEA
jgi:hypothetical protein